MKEIPMYKENDLKNNVICKVSSRLLTHVRLVRQNVLILSEVSLYVERSKNLEKKYVITVQKKFTFLWGFDRKNKVFGISRNLIDRFVFK